MISFPDCDSQFEHITKEYREGRRSYRFQTLCVLYSANRSEYLDLLTELIEDNDLPLANRYTFSGLEAVNTTGARGQVFGVRRAIFSNSYQRLKGGRTECGT